MIFSTVFLYFVQYGLYSYKALYLGCGNNCNESSIYGVILIKAGSIWLELCEPECVVNGYIHSHNDLPAQRWRSFVCSGNL